MELSDIGYVDMPIKCPKGTRLFFDPVSGMVLYRRKTTSLEKVNK